MRGSEPTSKYLRRFNLFAFPNVFDSQALFTLHGIWTRSWRKSLHSSSHNLLFSKLLLYPPRGNWPWDLSTKTLKKNWRLPWLSRIPHLWTTSSTNPMPNWSLRLTSRTLKNEPVGFEAWWCKYFSLSEKKAFEKKAIPKFFTKRTFSSEVHIAFDEIEGAMICLKNHLFIFSY